AASPVLNGGDEETGLDRPRLVATQLIDELVHVSLHRPVAAGRVRREPAARLHRQVGGFLYRLHRKIFGRLYDDSLLATDPGDNRGPVFVIVAPTRLAFLAATTGATSQRLLPALRRLPLVARGMVEVIGFNGTFQLAMHLIGHCSGRSFHRNVWM